MTLASILTHHVLPVATIIGSGTVCVVLAETNPTALAILTAITGTITGIEGVRVLRMPDPGISDQPAPVTIGSWATDTAITLFCFCIIVGYLALATGTALG